MVIREDVPTYMTELKRWLEQTRNEPLESMGDFFAARLDGYEAHMQLWSAAYRRMAQLVDADARTLLDLGCGTGLELDELLRLHPDLAVKGVDLSPNMLSRLKQKHPQVQTVQADYFAYDFGVERYDAIVSFETLHHFTADAKRALFAKLLRALKPGRAYLQADYIACCDEEELLLQRACEERRARDGVPPERFVHFDTPLTLAHELALLRDVGFHAEAVECIAGACFILAQKKG